MRRILLALLLLAAICLPSEAGMNAYIAGSGVAAPACVANAGDFSFASPGTSGGVFAQYATSQQIAGKFTADANAGAICGIIVYLTKVLSPTADLYASIWSDDGGSPGAPNVMMGNESQGIPAASIAVGENTFIWSGASGVTLSNGTIYWVVVRASGADGSNYYIWGDGAWTGNYYIRANYSPVSGAWTDKSGNKAYIKLLK